MRIGLFTDAYLPQISGFASSTALLQQALKDMGHLALSLPSDRGSRQMKRTYSVCQIFLLFLPNGFLSFILFRLSCQSLDLDIVHSQTEFGMGLYARQIAEQLDIPMCIHSIRFMKTG